MLFIMANSENSFEDIDVDAALTIVQEKLEDPYDDREEGELEEGELEDEEEEQEIEEPNPVKEEAITKPDLDAQNNVIEKQNEENNEHQTDKKRKRISQSGERYPKKHHNRDNRKKKRIRDRDDKKGRKHNHKEIGFDQILKQELKLLRGEVSTPEVVNDAVVDTGDSNNEEKEKKDKSKCLPNSKSKSPSRKSEAVCMFFLQGNCQKGNDCCYSHELTQPRKMELCKFYMTDRCAKKDKCLYMHKDFPCKFYHFGMKCIENKDCKFSHDTLQEPARNILLKHIELAPKDILGNFPRLPKNAGMAVLEITFNKRHSKPIEQDVLESVADLEGKGFKYIDRALKASPRLNSSNDSTKDKSTGDDKSQRSNKSSSDKDDRENREKSKDNDRRREHRRHRDRDDRDRRRHRSRESDQRRDRRSNDHRPRRNHENYNNRNNDKHMGQNEYPFNMPQGHRDLFNRIQSRNDNMYTERMEIHENYNNESQPTQWYSSDEEYDQRNANFNPHNQQPFMDCQPYQMGQMDNQANIMDDHIPASQNADINVYDDKFDINYLQDLLTSVRNATGNNTKQPEKTESKPADIAEDIKDVFDFSGEDKAVERGKSNFSLTLDLQNLIKSTREKCSTNSQSDSYVNNSNNRVSNEFVARDCQGHGNDANIRAVDNDRYTPPKDPRDPHRNRVPSIESKELSQPTVAKQNTVPQSSDIDSLNSLSINAQNSIYMFDTDDDDNPTTENDSNLPFKFPIHTPAKEINGSVNANPPMYYRLATVEVPKPSFSYLRFVFSESKKKEDPRLRIMFCNISVADEPSSMPPLPNLSQNDVAVVGEQSNNSFEARDIVKPRDPREKEARDPRMAGNLNRTQRDPRSLNQGHMDPRSLNPDHMDPRSFPPDRLEQDMPQNDMFMGGMMQNFNNIRPMHNPHGPNLHGPNPHGHNHHGPNQHGPNHHGPNPHGPNHHGPNPHGPNHRGPNPHGPNHRGPNPHGPNHHGPNPHGPNPFLHMDPRGRPGLLGAAPPNIPTRPCIVPGSHMNPGPLIESSNSAPGPPIWTNRNVPFKDPRVSRDM